MGGRRSRPLLALSAQCAFICCGAGLLPVVLHLYRGVFRFFFNYAFNSWFCVGYFYLFASLKCKEHNLSNIKHFLVGHKGLNLCLDNAQFKNKQNIQTNHEIHIFAEVVIVHCTLWDIFTGTSIMYRLK